MFDLGVAIGGVDEGLARELTRLGRLEDGDKWDPGEDRNLDMNIYDKFKGELYGLMCSITQGEAKTLVKSVVDSGKGNDGFRAFMILKHRYDLRNNATLLQAFLEVVGPPNLRDI